MRKFLVVATLLAATISVLPFNNYAQDEVGEEIKIYLGETKVISVSNPTRIVIGNPAIVDVANVGTKEITLNPKGAGQTTMVLWDNFGEQSFRIKVFTEDMSEVKRRVDGLLKNLELPEVYTKPEEEEGKLMLLGRVKDAKDKDRINTILGPLKEKTVDLIQIKEEESMVEIDVQVMELDKGATETLGFEWPQSIPITETGSKVLTGARWGELFKIFNVKRTAFSLTLNTLVQEGKARVLSRPRIACQSGKEAKLLVGGEIPVLTAVVTSQTTTGEVEYKEYGIILNIKPKIDPEQRRVHLNLGIEVSEVGTTAESTDYAKAYPLTKRNAYTELYLNDGETMAIGGLIKQKSEEDLRKFPWLADIPVLGLFFRNRTTKSGSGSTSKSDTELFITLTPTIVTEEEQGKLKSQPQAKAEITTPAIVSNLPQPLAGYAGIIQKRILDNLNYPASAREAGFQGAVKLSLRLSYRGELLDAKIKDSSGHKILDDNALAVAKGIDAYPPFPSSMGQKELWIDVPINYRLD